MCVFLCTIQLGVALWISVAIKQRTGDTQNRSQLEDAHSWSYAWVVVGIKDRDEWRRSMLARSLMTFGNAGAASADLCRRRYCSTTYNWTVG